MSRGSWIKALTLVAALLGFGGVNICAGSGLDRLLALAVRAAPGPGQRLRV